MMSRPDYSVAWTTLYKVNGTIAIVTFLEDVSAITQRYFLFKRHSEKLK